MMFYWDAEMMLDVFLSGTSPLLLNVAAENSDHLSTYVFTRMRDTEFIIFSVIVSALDRSLSMAVLEDTRLFGIG
jgi:hypothetical protein